jgi:NADH-quinone oxidoreductase subunit J
MIQQIVFYLFSAIAIATAAMVVISKSPVRAALFLVVTFIVSAGLWILLQAEFLGLILILVYVGAVMTLFLFVVMMLDMDGIELRSGFVRYLPFALIVLAVMLAFIILAVGHTSFGLGHSNPSRETAAYNNTALLGSVLYTQYAYPFVLAGALLLLAIIAAISLTFRGTRNAKKQRVEWQVSVRAQDRVYKTSMKNEKRL